MTYWVYILECNNSSYYTGYTTDLARRYEEHKQGINCKYTRSFKPIRIAQSWIIDEGKSQAMKIERLIKTMSKDQKIKLIAMPDLLREFIKLNNI
ncbi:MAG TPA: GIY-YIG nuclease family protein [Gammaproteobacteria bacterium]|nr:GIY-YIG nuclease family protein [Gammaproteobacteria bacterium]